MILHAVESGAGAAVALLHGLFGQSRNFGTLQRRLAATYRVIAVDLRNHGESRHAPTMSYPAMAEDVLETLRERGALPAVLVGHSMVGKVAMMTALEAPAVVARLLVADIAPVRYPPAYHALAAAMAAIPLHSGLTRAQADAALAAVAEPGVRAFLLQNLHFGAEPRWRIDLAAITAALPGLEDWPDRDAPPYAGPALFVAGEHSSLIRPEDRAPSRALFPKARFVTLKGTGHWLHADNPAGFAAVVEAFLAG